MIHLFASYCQATKFCAKVQKNWKKLSVVPFLFTFFNNSLYFCCPKEECATNGHAGTTSERNMKKNIIIQDSVLQKAAEEGMDAFVNVFVTAINDAIDGELTLENMEQLNADQITLLAWNILHEEVMDGGYIQLIHNGYGAFIFKNPFAIAVRNWGLNDLHKHIRKAYKLYDKFHEEIEKDCTDEEFMALFEKMPQFDDFDDEFIETEEKWTSEIAHYIDEHIENFATIA